MPGRVAIIINMSNPAKLCDSLAFPNHLRKQGFKELCKKCPSLKKVAAAGVAGEPPLRVLMAGALHAVAPWKSKNFGFLPAPPFGPNEGRLQPGPDTYGLHSVGNGVYKISHCGASMEATVAGRKTTGGERTPQRNGEEGEALFTKTGMPPSEKKGGICAVGK